MTDDDELTAAYMGGYYDAKKLYEDEIERLREALKQVGLYAWQGDTFKIMDIVRETIIGKEK